MQAVYAFEPSAELGGSIWRVWFLDMNRKQLAAKVEELRAALTEWSAVRASHRVPADGPLVLPNAGSAPQR